MELKPHVSNSGQAVVEYVLILFLSFMVFIMISRWFSTSGLLEKIVSPAKNQYKVLYKYGFSKTKGKEEGGPELHPSPYVLPSESRIFVNPAP